MAMLVLWRGVFSTSTVAHVAGPGPSCRRRLDGDRSRLDVSYGICLKCFLLLSLLDSIDDGGEGARESHKDMESE